MASKLGSKIRSTRLQRKMGLRQLARRIGKSPAYIVELERSKAVPGVSEETLEAIARELALDLDVLLPLAAKTPRELTPKSATEVALYRLVGQLPQDRQEALKAELEAEIAKPGPPPPKGKR